MKRITVLMLLLSIFCYFRITSANADPIGVWLFDEGNGKIVKDISGNEHHGEIVGEVAWADGKFETALEFDGGHVLVPHADVMNFGQWTMTAWIKVPKIVDPYQVIMAKRRGRIGTTRCGFVRRDDVWVHTPWRCTRLTSG